MLSCLNDWKGEVEINGMRYGSISQIPSDFKITDTTTILLYTSKAIRADEAPQASDTIYRITVKPYMLKKATNEFKFMAERNNDIPMPLKTMVGKIISETSGMYKMELKADTSFTELQCCMKCGKPITNNVSKFFGMGPECGSHGYTNPFDTEEELKEAISNYKNEVLSKITWTGWIIKSAITKMEEIK